MTIYETGDLVACYISNSSVYEELLVWGIVLEVSDTLKDVLVLDNTGNINWFPSFRWTRLKNDASLAPDIIGHLA
jgi:hypothetical protein